MGSKPQKASSSSQSANSEELTKGIRPLTDDSVYELYAPPDKGAPGVEVVFFHGLPLDHDDHTSTEVYWKTWLSRDGKVVWPKEWLPGSLSSPRILSVSYDAYARKHAGPDESYTIVERLIQDLILAQNKDNRVGQSCPVVLVGHSLGGIIIKEFLLKCLDRRGPLFNAIDQAHVELINNFLGNCKGVSYFSTPHLGSEFIDYLEKKQVPLNGPLMKLLGILSSQTARINSEFANVRKGEGFRTQGIAESLPTEYMGFEGKLVSEASARYDVDSFYTGIRVNHFDVCKPQNKMSCSVFQQFIRFIDLAITDKRPGLRTRVNEPVSHPARQEGPSEIQRPTEVEQEIEKLNDSVYELYHPRGVPRVVVIFFHGLPQKNDHRQAYLKTWLARDSTETVWPKEWLPERLRSTQTDPQILSVSYNSCPVPEDGGASDSYVIAENLIQDIILNDKCLSQHDCPVILVGHGLGGIIIKELLLACSTRLGQQQHTESAQKNLQRIGNFLDNCKGVFYYSTPHHGSHLIDHLATKVLARKKGYLAGKREPRNNLMELLSILNSKTERINSDFANGRHKKIRTRAIGENRHTTYMGFEGKIVEEGSARYDIDDLNFSTVDADHFDVCKPPDRTSNIFQYLVQFILTAIEIEQTEQTEDFEEMDELI